MENKDKDREISFFQRKSEEPKEPIEKDTKRLNDPSVPMRRKNRIIGDGKDWFDTHPDA